MNPPSALQLGQLFYAVIVAQQAGEISESKACELIGINLERYREAKEEIVQAVLVLAESLPSPLILLLEGMKGKPNS